MEEKRPLTQVNTSAPGTDVAAETAAAMASASLVFKTSDSSYSDTLLKHAKQLFNFADKYRGSYSVSIPEVRNITIQQDMEMSSCGQLAGSIMQQEIKHTLNILCKMEMPLLTGEVQPGLAGIIS